MKNHFYLDKIVEICNKKHLSVEEIYKEILKDFPCAGKSTIYRNVEELASDGILKKVKGLCKKTYFEKNIGNHIHLIDKNTGDIIDVEEEVKFNNLPKNFKLSDIDVRILGEFV